MPVLAQALRNGDARALAVLVQRMLAKVEAPPAAIAESEADSWLETLGALRNGFLKFSGYGRASALSVSTKILDRFGVEPAPARWLEALAPVHDLLTLGLADPDLDVRVTALVEIGRRWGWLPGKTPTPIEEQGLAEWKDGFQAPVVRRLGDREPKSRAAAVACLGSLPIDAAAAPAVAYLEDRASGAVRQQVLISFANRPALMSEDAIIKHLDDPETGVPETAETVLKIRGLNQEQISLARLISHPKPGMRTSVIPLLKDRTDIDPVVWLIQLSYDAEESVRASAAEALAAHDTPEARNRLAEMARDDRSPAVRAAAGKFITAALPPLPGSPSLNPKAN